MAQAAKTTSATKSTAQPAEASSLTEADYAANASSAKCFSFLCLSRFFFNLKNMRCLC